VGVINSATKKEPTEIYSVNRKDYLSALSFMKLFIAKESPVIFENGVLSGKADDQTYTATIEEVDREVKFGFNPIYMIDLLQNQFSTETITFEVRSENQPIIITDSNKDNGYALLMPMYLNK